MKIVPIYINMLFGSENSIDKLIRQIILNEKINIDDRTFVFYNQGWTIDGGIYTIEDSRLSSDIQLTETIKKAGGGVY